MTTAIYTHPFSKLHEMGDFHPDRPARIEAIEDALAADGIARFLEYREAPEANIDQIRRIHLLDAINMVRENTPDDPNDYFSVDGDTVLNMYSWQAALHSAGAGIAATNAVIAGEINNAFCLIRPLGHHARPITPMGYSIFNNVAIAAAHALRKHKLERIAIVDFDVHHGNGTDEAFALDPRVLMVSYYQAPLYPYMGNERERAHMVNVPVPKGTGGEEIRKIVTEQWLPAMHAHKPQMIFISAGFDAHSDDAMSGMELVEDDYAWMTRQIMDVADEYAQGRIVSLLEGGYNLKALANSVVAHVKTLARRD